MLTAFRNIIALAALISAVAFSGQASAAYTCSNPAICIAVCGSKTCGKIAADDASMRGLDTPAASTTITTQPATPKKAAPFTCPNPAICIAVCGSKTCG